jgi:hypothetical protein
MREFLVRQVIGYSNLRIVASANNKDLVHFSIFKAHAFGAVAKFGGGLFVLATGLCWHLFKLCIQFLGDSGGALRELFGNGEFGGTDFSRYCESIFFMHRVKNDFVINPNVGRCSVWPILIAVSTTIGSHISFQWLICAGCNAYLKQCLLPEN